MNKYELNVENLEKPQKHLLRSSYLTQAKHLSDMYLHLGYDYKGNILKKGTSKELWANPQQWVLYGRLESMIIYLVENTKMIKKWFSIAHDKNTTLIN